MKIIEKQEAQTLSVRIFTSLNDMPNTLRKIYQEVAALFGKDDIVCTGSPFVIYYNMDMENLEIEAGFPVSGAKKDYGRVKRSKLPGGEQATAQHKGPYDTLEETYTKLAAFCKAEKREPEEYMYEEYLNSPEDTAVEDLLTNIYFLLK